jgi:hypothetical protein
VVLFAQGDDQRASRVGFGLGFGSPLAQAEEVGRLVAELVAQDAEGTRGIAEAPGDFVGGEMLDEIGAQRLVLALGGGVGFEEEPGFLR